MNNDIEYNGSNEVYPSYTEYNNFQTNNMDIKPPKKRRKWPIVLLILLLLIVGVLIYFTFFTDKLDFIKPNDNYSEFDPDKGKIESNSNVEIKSNITSNKSNSNKSNSNKSNSNKTSNTNKVVEKIVITPNTPSVVVGSKITLKTTITPLDVSDKSITWKSGDTKIATVNSKGVVTGVKVGTTTITATSKNGKKASVKVTVTNKVIPVTGLVINGSSKIIDNDETYSIYYMVAPSNATNQNVTFTSSNTKVAKVSSTGVVTPVAIGDAKIIVTTKDGNISRNFTIFVRELDVQSITLNIPTTLYVDKTDYAKSNYSPTTSLYGTSIKYYSSDTSIATVHESTGKITGISEGDAIITAKSSNGKTASKTIQVRLNPDDYKLKFEIFKSGATYSYVIHDSQTFFDYKSITYNGYTFSPEEDGKNLIPFINVDESITTATMITKGGYKLTIKVEYTYYDL